MLEQQECSFFLLLVFYRFLKFLFHCYSGGTEFLERSLEFKSLLAFGGALTWKGKASENLREAFLKTPLNRIIFETDVLCNGVIFSYTGDLMYDDIEIDLCGEKIDQLGKGVFDFIFIAYCFSEYGGIRNL